MSNEQPALKNRLGLSVLVIDDNPDYFRIFKLETGIEKHVDVIDYCNGQELVGGLKQNSFKKIRDKIKSRDWSLILLDLFFEAHDGISPFGRQIYQELKKWRPDLPIVMLTIKHEREVHRESNEVRIPYLSKDSISWGMLIRNGLLNFTTSDATQRMADLVQVAMSQISDNFDLTPLNKSLSREQQNQLTSCCWHTLVVHGFFMGIGPQANKSLGIHHKRHLLELLEHEIGFSEVILDVFFKIFSLAGTTRKPILLQGETGSGKEVFARYFHRLNLGEKAKFNAVNVTTITGISAEAEVFGYAPGAFTGADKKGFDGMIHETASGTLFLDEFGELDKANQGKFLRVFQFGTYSRLMEREEKTAKCHFIVATWRNVYEVLRQDLRERVITIHLPPLREHKEDIETLAKHFISIYMKENFKAGIEFSPEVFFELEKTDFSGNVRELEHLIERLIVANPSYARITSREVNEFRTQNAVPMYLLSSAQSNAVPCSIAIPTDIQNLVDVMNEFIPSKNDPSLEGGGLLVEDAFCCLAERLLDTALQSYDNTKSLKYLIGKHGIAHTCKNSAFSRLGEKIKNHDIGIFRDLLHATESGVMPGQKKRNCKKIQLIQKNVHD